MNKIIAIVLLSFVFVANSYAASWMQLQENKHAKLMLDKQSVLEVGQHKKVWVKIAYKASQVNLAYPEKTYNNAKLLWFFDCNTQKSATAQVYQFMDEELVFSAAIDAKKAQFLEPVPETEIDIAMRYVCKKPKPKKVAIAKPTPAELKKNSGSEKEDGTEKDSDAEKGLAKGEALVLTSAPVKAEDMAKKEGGDKKGAKHKEADDVKSKGTKSKDGKSKGHDASEDKEEVKKVKGKKPRKVRWSYRKKRGPEFWGQLSPDYVTCETGRSQSPIDITRTLVTTQKPLKTFLRFPGKDIMNNGHTVQVSFKPGNMLVIDTVIYQMLQMHFHAPSENMIHGKSYPVEAHFVHADPDGNLAVIAVMFEKGHESKALARLWKQLPKFKGKPKKLKSRVLASDLMPRKKAYYRFSGSLTTPPCSEGVVWIVMKNAMTASEAQIKALKRILKHDNNRPVQPVNGRVVTE